MTPKKAVEVADVQILDGQNAVAFPVAGVERLDWEVAEWVFAMRLAAH
jgi:hypothetical protein